MKKVMKLSTMFKREESEECLIKCQSKLNEF